MIVIGDKGKGSSSSASNESPNTLQSNAIITVVEALGEGEIEGLVNGLKSVYFDGTPIQNYDGTINRQGVELDFRPGTEAQDPFLGNNRTGTPVTVEQQVKYGVPVVRTITERADQVKINIRVPALAFQDDERGLVPTSVGWEVQRRATGGVWETVETVNISNQKCTSPYNRMTVVDRPPGDEPFDIRIVRLTPDSTELKLQNDTFWESYVALVKGQYVYPHTALVRLKINAKKFGTNLGSRAYHVRGLKTPIPSNYDPIARTYTGIWDGSFKIAWHNNPAWVFYDLVTNNRYGLGEFIDASLVDKWALYQIGRYCDQLVPSGFADAAGNNLTEPRFTFNGVINTRQDAYKVLQEITAAFRGMAYWSLGQVVCSADMPADPVAVLTPANVIGGVFHYSSTAMKARHSVAMIGWNDPDAMYQQSIEVVQNNAMLTKFGWRQVDLNLIGCTSRGQAHRYGKWVLDTEQHETETVQFQMSWDGYVLFENRTLKPGDIIVIADPRKNGGFRAGGRIAAATSLVNLTLDSAFEAEEGVTYKLTCMMPDGKLASSAIASFDGASVTLANALPSLPSVNADWIIEGTNMNARRYRVLAVQEEGTNLFKVTAIYNDPTKYARVEKGVSLEPIQYVRPRDTVSQVTNVTSVESRYFQGGVSHSRLTLSWTAPNSFQVEAFTITADSPRGFVAFPSTTFPSIDVNDPAPGNWTFYISARSHTGVASIPVAHSVAVEGWEAVSGPLPSNLRTSEGGNTFTGRSVTLLWDNVFPVNALPYPVENVVRIYDAHNALLRTEVVKQPNYTYDYEKNVNDGGPRRSLRIDVTAKSVTGEESAVASIDVSNPPPAAVMPDLKAGVGSINVSYQPVDNDFAGTLIWASQNFSFAPDLSNYLYDGPDTTVPLTLLSAGKWYVWIGNYDAFGRDELNISPPSSVTINDLNGVLSGIVPALVNAKGAASVVDVERLAESLALVLAQIINDRDENDIRHQRMRQAVSVRVDDLAATVAEESQARIDGDSAIASQIEVLQSTVANDVQAAIVHESTARASADNALATEIGNVVTQVNGHTAQLTTISGSYDGLKVQWGVIGSIDGVTGGFMLEGVKKLDGTVSYDIKVRGDMIVDGSVGADKLNVNELTAISANFGNATVDGRLSSPNGRLVHDFTNGRILVYGT